MSRPDVVHRMNAIKYEYNSVLEHSTWSLMSRPADGDVGSNELDYKLKEKQKKNGGIGLRYNARLVAGGIFLLEGACYSETFSLLNWLTSIRVRLSIEAELHF